MGAMYELYAGSSPPKTCLEFTAKGQVSYRPHLPCTKWTWVPCLEVYGRLDVPRVSL